MFIFVIFETDILPVGVFRQVEKTTGVEQALEGLLLEAFEQIGVGYLGKGFEPSWKGLEWSWSE